MPIVCMMCANAVCQRKQGQAGQLPSRVWRHCLASCSSFSHSARHSLLRNVRIVLCNPHNISSVTWCCLTLCIRHLTAVSLLAACRMHGCERLTPIMTIVCSSISLVLPPAAPATSLLLRHLLLVCLPSYCFLHSISSSYFLFSFS